MEITKDFCCDIVKSTDFCVVAKTNHARTHKECKFLCKIYVSNEAQTSSQENLEARIPKTNTYPVPDNRIQIKGILQFFVFKNFAAA